MLNWLKDNVYIAAWLALPIMVVVALVQGRSTPRVEGRPGEVWPIKKVLVYLLFLICFPITLTPWAESGARIVCGFSSLVLFGFIVFTSDRDWMDKESEH